MNTKKIALTGICGGIGSGKSVVSRILRLKGYSVYDCDLEARQLMESQLSLRKNLISIAGGNIYRPDGRLDRAALGSRLFADAELRLEINRLVHSAVRDHLRIWIRNRMSRGESRLFVESAILVSSGLADMCDRIWMVTAPEEKRIERIVRRNGLPYSEARKRIESQSGEELELTKLQRLGERIFEIENRSEKSVLSRIDNLLKES